MTSNAPRLLALLAAASFAACVQPSVSAPVTAAETPVSKEVATSPGKPSAPVDIRFVTSGQPLAGVPFAVEVWVTPSSAADALTVEIAPGEGLALNGGSKRLQFAAKPGAAHMERVSVVPSAGYSLLRVTAIMQSGGVEERKVAVLPLHLAGAALPASKPVEATPQGEKIISLPAQEDSRPR